MKNIKYLIIAFLLLLPLNIYATDEYSETFQKLTTDGNLTINGVDPQDIDMIGNMVWTMMMDTMGVGVDNSYAGRSCTAIPGSMQPPICDTEKHEEGYYVIIAEINSNTPNPESHELHVYFTEENLDAAIKEKANDLKTTLSGNTYTITDMGFINFIYTIPTGKTETDKIDYSILYSDSIINETGNQNIVYRFLPGMGGTTPFDVYAQGELTLSYKEGIYAVATMVKSSLKNIIYVPDETEDENLIEEALVRIYDYLGINSGITIEEYKTIEQVLADSDEAIDPYGIFNDVITNEYNGLVNRMIYTITMNGNTFYTFIEKNSNKMIMPYLRVNDENTNIKISANTGSVPLDINFEANYITSGADFDTIKDKISGDFAAVDLSLYSYVNNSYIKELTNGKFEVGIPVPDSLNGKTIKVYYITENGEIEEHDANPVDGLAIFETAHFSTYIVAEKQTINPKTADTIIKNIILLLISLSILIISSNTIKNRIFNKA